MRRKVFAMILVALVTITVFAHPGRTDSQGGHTNRSTGQYHFHHGYPEHQHTGGVCPYDYDDKTGESSGTTSEQRTDPKKALEALKEKYGFSDDSDPTSSSTTTSKREMSQESRDTLNAYYEKMGAGKAEEKPAGKEKPKWWKVVLTIAGCAFAVFYYGGMLYELFGDQLRKWISPLFKRRK